MSFTIRTDRLGVLIEQLTDGVELSRLRIDGVTDDEFLWAPAPGAFTIHARSLQGSPDQYGPGDVVLDHDRSGDPFSGGRISTIAWRVGHLTSAYAGRWEWTFGARTTDPDVVVDFSPSAEVMFTRLWAEIDRWVAALEALTTEQLDVPGYGQYPHGLDPQLPFIGIIRWMNRETIHHLAEIALLRDLYSARVTSSIEAARTETS
jgi:hypothetical protein